MTKSDFILSLSEALSDLPGQERVRILEYYEEMLDDRIESGMTEEESVAAMGSIEEILKEAAPDALNARHKCSTEIVSEPVAQQITFCEPVEVLVANSGSADLHVLRSDLPDGVTARINHDLPENLQCVCTLNSGRLEVHCKQVHQRNFSFRNLFSCYNASITVTLDNATLDRGDIVTSSGSIDLSGLVFTHSLEAKTASGDLDAHNVAIQRSCQLHTASGDITATDLTCGELLELQTASGDIEISESRIGKIKIGTASGDVKLSSSECDELHCASASGDIQIRDVSCTENVTLSSNSGDITGRLIPVENYRFIARSRSGDIKVPHYSGNCPAEIHTLSGDITFKAH